MNRTTNGSLSQIARRALMVLGLLAAGTLMHGGACAQSRAAVTGERHASAVNDSPGPTAASSDKRNAVGTEPEDAAAKGTGEGIKIHGHWTIEIRNPDGKVQSHTEFENALVSQGAVAISTFLAGQQSVGLWGISLQGVGGPCLGPGALATGCTLVSNANLIPFEPTCSPSNCFAPVTISPNAAGFTVSALTLQGTAVAPSTLPNNANINSVSTSVWGCGPSVAPTTCMANETYGLGWQFSSKTLDGVGTDPSPVPVSAGQTIAVTVQFTFQ